MKQTAFDWDYDKLSLRVASLIEAKKSTSEDDVQCVQVKKDEDDYDVLAPRMLKRYCTDVDITQKCYYCNEVICKGTTLTTFICDRLNFREHVDDLFDEFTNNAHDSNKKMDIATWKEKYAEKCFLHMYFLLREYDLFQTSKL